MTESPATRIAVVGNMNNGGFTIMRYLRDLGADAHLLAYASDGTGNLAHFAPQADTWEWSKWAPFVTVLPFPNTTASIVGAPQRLRLPPAASAIRRQFAGFDRFIGSGVAPALFERAGMVLDAFFPYGIGVEFYGDHAFLARAGSSRLRQVVTKRTRSLQARGIRRARNVFNAELGFTQRSLHRIGANCAPLGIPAVYNRGAAGSPPQAPHLAAVLEEIASADISMISAARQLWQRDPAIPAADWASYTKNSDWLIRGLRQFVDAHPGVRPLVCLLEYGPDVAATKTLATELGVDRYIRWLGVMPRREVMLLLGACDVGVGEFYVDPGLLWGGTGWEILASGKPMVQTFNFTPAEYAAQFGHPAPPLFDVRAPEDVARALEAVWAMPDRGAAMGGKAAAWFDEHGGIGLARKWLAAIERGAGGTDG